MRNTASSGRTRTNRLKSAFRASMTTRGMCSAALTSAVYENSPEEWNW